MFQMLNTLEQAIEDYKSFSNEECCNILSKENQNIRNDNGLNKIYYLEGKGDLFQEFYMKDGKKSGVYTDYYPTKMMDGKIVRRQVVNFKNDLEDGLYIQYWEGVNHAEWKIYEIEYKNGLKHGIYKKYAALVNCSMWNNGQPYINVDDNYKNGEKHGLCTTYLLSQPNVIESQEEYINGKKISESDMHEASIVPSTSTKSTKRKTSKKSDNREDNSTTGYETPRQLVNKIKSKQDTGSMQLHAFWISTTLWGPNGEAKWGDVCEILKDELPEVHQFLAEKQCIPHTYHETQLEKVLTIAFFILLLALIPIFLIFLFID